MTPSLDTSLPAIPEHHEASSAIVQKATSTVSAKRRLSEKSTSSHPHLWRGTSPRLRDWPARHVATCRDPSRLIAKDQSQKESPQEPSTSPDTSRPVAAYI